MLEALEGPYNASSVHAQGRKGAAFLAKARTQIAALVNAPPNMVIFNSGATEGNNTVLHYFLSRGERVLVSAIEHPCVAQAAKSHDLRIPASSDGQIDLGALEDLLKDAKAKGKPYALVSLMAVNNETGVIQPVAKAAEIVKRYGALLHCDAVQAAGRMAFSMPDTGADFITLSAHKLGGPQGAGALVLGLCGITPILLQGGGQEKSARAGTENVAAIAGFGAAAEAAQKSLSAYQDLSALRDEMEQKLKLISPEIIIHGEDAPRAASTTLFSLPGADSQTMLMILDLDGIAVSAGSACSSGTIKTSATLKAMGVSDNIARGTLRVSMGWGSTRSDVEGFLGAWERLYTRIKPRLGASHQSFNPPLHPPASGGKDSAAAESRGEI
jgi:cysteine desulfurase